METTLAFYSSQMILKQGSPIDATASNFLQFYIYLTQ